jgi:hypothetical protein
MKTSDKFLEYLQCNIPEEYPIDSIRISIDMAETHRKELVFQQFKFIQLAQEYSNDTPWIAYIAILKHKLIFEFFKTSTASFKEISDKEYFDMTQTLAEQVETNLIDKLDDLTKCYCERLSVLQVVHSSIVAAQKIVDDALQKNLIQS